LIEKICEVLTKKIQKEMPEVDEERAEVINYGLQLVIGEIPKIFIIFAISYVLGVFKLTLFSFIFIMPYRAVSGGTHLHTHIGCIIATSVFYIGNALSSKYLILEANTKYIVVCAIWIFSMWMIKLYAPADTRSVPILRKKERRIKQTFSYVFMTLTLVLGLIIKNNVISNLLIIGTLLQTITITRFMYKLTKNQYGYLEYIKQNAT